VPSGPQPRRWFRRSRRRAVDTPACRHPLWRGWLRQIAECSASAAVPHGAEIAHAGRCALSKRREATSSPTTRNGQHAIVPSGMSLPAGMVPSTHLVDSRWPGVERKVSQHHRPAGRRFTVIGTWGKFGGADIASLPHPIGAGSFRTARAAAPGTLDVGADTVADQRRRLRTFGRWRVPFLGCFLPGYAARAANVYGPAPETICWAGRRHSQNVCDCSELCRSDHPADGLGTDSGNQQYIPSLPVLSTAPSL
jgi:hypothetical protein